MKNTQKILVFLSLILSHVLFANNLQIGTPTVNLNNELVFTISWDNSWFTNSAPNNWDGVYVFAKYRDCASTGAWNHVVFSTDVTELTAGAPLEIDDYKLDGNGVIIKRSSIGAGNITNVTISLKMQTPIATISNYDFKVFGIEMVYIPTGDFYLGDGFSTYTIEDGNTNAPLHVTSDGPLTRGTGAGQIYSVAPTTVPASIPLDFPLGYDSIYVMKYEITQGQWVDFLNTLSSDQANRFSTYNASRVNYAGSWPNFTTLYPHRAAGFISWQDILAFLDWSTLRPMTETEYEKICRGPNYPVSAEYAWGTNLIQDVTSISNDGTATESNANNPPVGSGIANYGGSGILGPMRNGFAATPTTNRVESGATYYGVMEMSGNVSEYCINIFHAQGRAFTDTHGDGYLLGTPNAGLSDVATWPSNMSGSLGMTPRGGSTFYAEHYIRVSYRNHYAISWAQNRYYYYGGRGVR